MGFLIRWLVIAGALWVATAVVDGIEVTATTTWGKIGTYIVVALIFGLVNAILKPILHVVGCIFYALTLGLISLVVNALLFLLVGWLSDQFGIPFEVNGFWAGFWGAIIVGVISWVMNMAFGSPQRD
jgi:putative membrane protein